jgi:anti-sigma factor RsiW
MTPYALAVLRVLSRAERPVGWHYVETRLSMVALEERQQLPEVLADFVARGWIAEVHADTTPTERWAITPLGRRAVNEVA